MASPSAPFNTVVSSLMVTRISSSLQLVALSSLITAWIFFFDGSLSGSTLIWSIANFWTIVPIVSSYILLWRARRTEGKVTISQVGVHVILEGVNILTSGFALAIEVVILIGCSPPDCTNVTFVWYLIIVSSIIVAGAIIGLASAGYAILLYQSLQKRGTTSKKVLVQSGRRAFL